MKHLKVAVDPRPLQHLRSGIGRYTLHSIAGLSKLGAEVAVPPWSAQRQMRSKHFLNELARTQLTLGLWSRQSKADVFWSPRHHLPQFLGSLPSVVTVHDLCYLIAPQTMRQTRATVDKLLTESAIRRAQRVVAISEATASSIQNAYPSASGKTVVVPAAPTIAHHERRGKLPRSISSIGEYCLMVGTMEPRKNIERSLEGFMAARQRRCKLVLVANPGWGNTEDRVKAILNRSKGNIIWLQNVPDDALAACFESARFLLMPSLYEGFGLPLVEAMQFGVPAITSNNSSMPEVSRGSAILVDPYNCDEIAKAVEVLSEDLSTRNKLSEVALRESRYYSWEKSSHLLKQALESTLSDSF